MLQACGKMLYRLRLGFWQKYTELCLEETSKPHCICETWWWEHHELRLPQDLENFFVIIDGALNSTECHGGGPSNSLIVIG